ncbi:MAG: DNA-formamidopyrimidine glycosylase family protein, partial [Verrucomicrobiota bacterium]|nr:DNA-formamidopyrimidine glycosylase family protein [Verrucomicrobiota bacterium]
MPEGPEIKQIADELATALVGQKLTEVFFAFDHLKPWESVLCGRKVKRVRPRGKALLTEFRDLAIYSHNQLYGRWFVVKRGEELQTNRQLRLALHTRRHACLLYSASDIEILNARAVESHPFISKLGPDVLDET